MDRLDKAIAAFEDESSDLTLGQRVALLRSALFWNAFETLKRIKKEGTKAKVKEEDEFKQIECMKIFREMEKMYTAEVKMNKLMGKDEDKLNDDFLKVIKEMKSTMGSIVRDLNEQGHGEK